MLPVYANESFQYFIHYQPVYPLLLLFWVLLKFEVLSISIARLRGYAVLYSQQVAGLTASIRQTRAVILNEIEE